MSEITRREFARVMTAAAGVTLAGPLVGRGDAPSPEGPARRGSLTDVPGIRVGQVTDTRRPTGCTAILFDDDATAGVDYDGSAPGSYLGVLFQPVSPLDKIHGLLLTGGGPMSKPRPRPVSFP